MLALLFSADRGPARGLGHEVAVLRRLLGVVGDEDRGAVRDELRRKEYEYSQGSLRKGDTAAPSVALPRAGS